MAPPKGGTSGSNVLKLDEVRRRRLGSRSANEPDAPVNGSTNVTLSPGAEAVQDTESGQTRRRADEKPDRHCDTSKKRDTVKTPAKRSRVSNRRFDKVKVDRIKDEIACGKYTIDYLQVADKFIEHERYS